MRTLGIAVVMLGIGWAAGNAQPPAQPGFELHVNAPEGETVIECVRGCDLAWVERGFASGSRPVSRFTYACTGSPRCSSGRIGGWLRP